MFGIHINRYVKRKEGYSLSLRIGILEYRNMKEQIKSRILVEMQSVLNREQLQELKLCLDRNLYNVVIESECQSELV